MGLYGNAEDEEGSGMRKDGRMGGFLNGRLHG